MCRDNNHLMEIVNEDVAKIEGVDHTKTNMYLTVLKYAQPDLNFFINDISFLFCIYSV